MADEFIEPVAELAPSVRGSSPTTRKAARERARVTDSDVPRLMCQRHLFLRPSLVVPTAPVAAGLPERSRSGHRLPMGPDLGSFLQLCQVLRMDQAAAAALSSGFAGCRGNPAATWGA
jgi:hypothetical protein